MDPGSRNVEEPSGARTISAAKGAIWYAAALTGVFIALWLAIETGFIKINLAVTLGEREGDDTYFSFDPTTKSTRDGYVLMDTTLSFRAPQPNLVHPDKPYRSITALRAYDCHRSAIGLIQTKRWYSEESAKGEVVAEDDEVIPLDKVIFKPTVPGSGAEQLVRIACSDTSRTRLWWAAIKLHLLGGKLDIPGL